MSQQASITLNAVVYDPAGAPKGKPVWVNRTGGVLNSFSDVTQTFVSNVGGKKLTKASFVLEVPIVATTDSTCSCSGTLLRMSRVYIEFSMDPGATAAERTDLYLRAKDLISTSLVQGTIEDLDPAYA